MNYEAHMLLWENTYAQVKQLTYYHKTTMPLELVLEHSAILIIIEGDIDLWVDETPYHVDHFSIFHIGMSDFLSIKCKCPSSYYLLYYQADIIYTDTFVQHLYTEHRPFSKSFSCVPTNPIAIELLMQDMYVEWRLGSFEKYLTVKIAFYELIYCIFDELAEGKGKPHPIDLAAQAQIFLEKHIDETITMQKLANVLKVSTRHVLRVFKERFGVGPQQYLTQRRIELAQQYLIDTRLTVKDIANQLGYEDEYYFSRVFKKQLGIAPTVYRKNTSLVRHVDSALVEPLVWDRKNYNLYMRELEKQRKKHVFKMIQSPFLLHMLYLVQATTNK